MGRIYTLGWNRLHWSATYLGDKLDLQNIGANPTARVPWPYTKPWPFTVWINCSRDLKKFANYQPLASNFKKISQSLEHFLTYIKTVAFIETTLLCVVFCIAQKISKSQCYFPITHWAIYSWFWKYTVTPIKAAFRSV